MGLFDKFKKKNTEVTEVQEGSVAESVCAEKEEVVEAVTEEPVTKPEEKEEAIKETPVAEDTAKQNEPQMAEVANEGRRFTLLVENAKQLSEAEGIMLAGMLYGKVQVGDSVYVLLPNHMIRMTQIDGIEIAEGQKAEWAENQKVVLQFKEIKDINQVPRYSVITSIRPQEKPSENTSVENPQLLGISMDYPRLNKDPFYMNLLIYELCHAYFLVPARVNSNAEANSAGTQIRFPGLPDPMDNTKSVFTIFTDWLALANWKNLFDEEHPPKAIIMRFPDVVNVINGSGVSLNPFGPTSIYLPSEVIQKITSLEGYKQEFSNKAQ